MPQFEAIYEDAPESEEKAPKAAVEKEVVEDEVVEEPQYTEEEQQAIAKGWSPDGVEGKPNISAGEFLRNESFFDKISKQNKTIKTLETQLDEIVKQHSKIAEIERTKALNELKQQKKQAYEDEDFDKVVEIDDKIAEAKSIDTDASPKKAEEVTFHPDFEPWLAENPWYNPKTNPEVFEEASAYAESYRLRTGKDGRELYDHVKNTMKRLHPEAFGVPSKQAPTVEGAGRSPRTRSKTRKHTKADLNETQRRVMDRYVKSGVMTEQEYINDLAAIGELG